MKMPTLILRDFDNLLVRCADAEAMAVRAAHLTRHPYQLVSRQADFARRIRSIIDGKDKA